MDGWISLHRKISKNQLWLSEPFTDGQAWIDLLLLANHKDGMIKVRGIRLPVNRGQVGWSKEKLAKRWQWSRGKVLRFLKFLEKEKMIKMVQQKNDVTTLISIINYKEYQQTVQQTVQQTDTNNNVKNIILFENNKEGEIFNEKMLEVFKDWLRYKKTRRESYKCAKSQKMAFEKLGRLSNNNPEIAKQIIEEAMTSNYAGFFALKNPIKRTPPPANSEIKLKVNSIWEEKLEILTPVQQ